MNLNLKMKPNSKPIPQTDEELVAIICRDKNTVLFGQLYDRYESKVYNKCFGFVKSKDQAMDLTQDIFLQVFTKLNSFKGNSSFSTWLYALTYNLCANFVSRDRESKINKNAEKIEDYEQHLKIEVSDNSLFQMRTGKLHKALELLDPQDKAILLLKYQDDVSIKELETLLHLGESAVKMRLKRAKARVTEAYNNL